MKVRAGYLINCLTSSYNNGLVERKDNEPDTHAFRPLSVLFKLFDGNACGASARATQASLFLVFNKITSRHDTSPPADFFSLSC